MAKTVSKTKSKTKKEVEVAARVAARAAVLAANRQAEEAAEEEAAAAEEEAADEGVTDFFGLNVQREAPIAGKPEGFDLFRDLGQKMVDAGDVPRYMIYQNGPLLTTLEHPTSWEDIQKQFGGGLYRVQVKSAATGRYHGQDTKQLANPPGWKGAPASREEEKSSTAELMGLMTQMQTQAEQRASSSSDKMMTIMVGAFQALAQPKQDSTSTILPILLEMQRQNNDTMTKLADTQNRMFEKLSERIEKSAEGKKDQFSFTDIFKMMESSKKEGFENFKMIQTLAKEFADQRGDDEGKEKSFTETLIESLLPVLAAGAARSMTQTPQPQIPPQQRVLQPVQRPVVAPVVPPVQRPTPVAAPVAPVAQPKEALRPAAQERGSTALDERRSRSEAAESAATGQAPQGKRVTPNGVRPLPATGFRNPPGQRAVKPAESPKKTPQVVRPNLEGQDFVEAQPQEAFGRGEELSKKDIILQVSFPILSDCLEKNVKASDCAYAVLSALAGAGVTQDDVRAIFTWQDIEAIVNQYSIPAQFVAYLREFHEAMVRPISLTDGPPA